MGSSGEQARQDSAAVVEGRLWEVDSDSRFGSAKARSGMDDMAKAFAAADAVVHAVDVNGLAARGDVQDDFGGRLQQRRPRGARPDRGPHRRPADQGHQRRRGCPGPGGGGQPPLLRARPRAGGEGPRQVPPAEGAGEGPRPRRLAPHGLPGARDRHGGGGRGDAAAPGRGGHRQGPHRRRDRRAGGRRPLPRRAGPAEPARRARGGWPDACSRPAQKGDLPLEVYGYAFDEQGQRGGPDGADAHDRAGEARRPRARERPAVPHRLRGEARALRPALPRARRIQRAHGLAPPGGDRAAVRVGRDEPVAARW